MAQSLGKLGMLPFTRWSDTRERLYVDLLGRRFLDVMISNIDSQLLDYG